MLRKLLNIAAFAAVLGSAAIGEVNADNGPLTPAQMREDLTFLKQEWAKLDRSFNDQQRLEFEKFVDAAAAAAEKLSPQMFALELMRATAIARNGHTNANAAATLLGPDLPIRVWAFPDGLYVVKAHPDFGHLLGARVDKIGSMETAAAMQQLQPYISGTDQRIRFLSPGYLVSPAVLRQIGAIEDEATVPLTLTLANGQTETIQLRPSKDGDPGDERLTNLSRGYSVLTPDPKELAGRWLHVLDSKSELSPIYGTRSDVQAQFLGGSKDVLYIRNDSGRSIDKTPLPDKFAWVVLTNLLPAKPRYVIVDLRFHNGGDLFNAIQFAGALPRLVPRDGHVFVLVSRATFSAGITTAAMLKGADKSKVTLVGEPMGDSGQFWAEGASIKLPNSQIPVRYSTEFHDYETGCFELGKCYWAVVAFGPRDISIMPEMPVDVKFADYAAGRDPVLEAALAETGKN